MIKTCPGCGSEFETSRSTKKTCSERCKKRLQRSPKGGRRPSREEAARSAPAVALPTGVDQEAAGVYVATLAELEVVGRVGSPAGQAALVLARRLDQAYAETGAGVASLAKQHAATLAEALKNAKAEVDPLDELRLRRERKLAGG